MWVAPFLIDLLMGQIIYDRCSWLILTVTFKVYHAMIFSDDIEFPNQSSSIVRPPDTEANISCLEHKNGLPSEDHENAVHRRYKNKSIPTHYRIDDIKWPNEQGNLRKKPKVAPSAPKNPIHSRNGHNKKPTPLKKAIIQARVGANSSDAPKVVVSIDEDDLDVSIINFLQTIKQKQDILWKQNENKARSRRRVVCGIHETTKHLNLKDVRCVVVANNIDFEVVHGSASDLFNCLRSICLADNVPLIFASTKKGLSKAVNKFPYTNVIGVLRFDGYEEDFANITARWSTHGSHVSYHKDQSSIFP